jgi:branched-subunit amino acid transport protein
MQMSDFSMWMVFVAVGVGTFLIRLSFIELYGKLRIPTLLSQALVYVPASVLAALVLPAIVFSNGTNTLALTDARLPAAVVAVLVAWFSKNTILTLIAGMGSLWILQYLGW